MQSTKQFTLRYLKKLPLGLLVVLALFAGVLFSFGYIIHEVIWEQENAADQHSYEFIEQNILSDGLTPIMKEVTWFASARFMQIAYLALILLYVIMRDWKRSIEITVIGLGGFAVNYFMKLWFARERPPGPLIDRLYNFSFPSGHATSALIFYGLCTYLLWKSKIPKVWKWVSAVILFLFSLLIGFSRVYLRVHYASDVLAGFCVGSAWLILIIFILEKLKKKSDKEMA